jgi:hypothetical protein
MRVWVLIMAVGLRNSKLEYTLDLLWGQELTILKLAVPEVGAKPLDTQELDV